ncbi:MAG TPA: protein kinase [Candidatus Dormibacteraeota bacterium]|nr:protein kinase [Candidatus Dormibacteraeota bacterium]
MSPAAGTRLGPYEIVAPIGAGGMGEVYRARDTRLGRDVAIKILPQHLTEKADARQRFEREARAVSSLNHAHICTLYDIGQQDGADFLVMELLDGETLAKRLEKGSLVTAEVLRVAIEIADALEKAHRQGILHRDLKPSNIMLTKGGAKLMDFGLAKAAGDGGAPALSSLTQSLNAAAKTTPVTAEGTIVGTFQYMSPEQMEGKEADARSDIFSFGAVLFEMATGKRAFEGKTTASVIAAILEREPPPISSVQPMSPPVLDRAVRICLAKDPDERFQSAHDVKLQLEWIRDAGSQAGIAAPVVAHRKHRERIAWAAAVVGIIVAAVFATGYIERAAHPAPAVVSQVLPPPGNDFALGGSATGPPALSPDGQKLAFAATGSDGKQLLWVRRLDSATAQPLAGTDGATYPFWSTDGRNLGFFGGNKLNRIAASGGPVIALCDAPSGRGGSWGRDDTILFTPFTDDVLYRVPASGGTPTAVTKLFEPGEHTDRWPQFLPDEKHFLFYAQSLVPAKSGTFVASLDGGKPKLLVRGDSNAVYTPPGYLLFVRQGTLMAQRFDAENLLLTGPARVLSESALENPIVWNSMLALSDNGTLVYNRGTRFSGDSELLWLDRSGKHLRQTGTTDNYADVSISPDGNKLAVTVEGTEGNNIWVFDLIRDIKTRLTMSQNASDPAWSPDGKRIAFTAIRGDMSHIYEITADGSGKTQPIVADDADEFGPEWSADGRFLVYNRAANAPGSHVEIWAMPMFGDRKPFPILQSAFSINFHALSPDGKWLAYGSPEGGTPQLYIQRFSGGGTRWQVSTDNVYAPKWRRDGKELFYYSLANKLIMSVQITQQGSSLTVGKPTPLSQANLLGGVYGRAIDATADGKQFVVISQAGEQASPPLTLVTNWPALLKKQ